MLITSGVVGNFLLWERLQGVMFTNPSVIGGGGGVGVPNEWFFIKGKNLCSIMGV